MRVAVAAAVFCFEVPQEIFRVGKAEFVALAAIAEVDAAMVVRLVGPRFAAKICGSSFFERGEFRAQPLGGNFLRDSPQHGAGIILHDVARENAESGESARKRGYDDLRDAQSFGQGAGVQASCATEGDESEVARVAAALDGDDADCFLHGGVDYADHSRGKIFQGETRVLFFQPFLRDAAGAIEIEREVSAEKALGLQAAEKKIGVGDGGLQAAAVADGAGIGAGGFGSDAENAGGVEAGERASAGTDGVNVEHRYGDGKACNLRVGGGFDFVFDQGDIGGSSSHVEGDDVVEAAGARSGECADHASRGAGEHSAHGFAGGCRECSDASAGLHDEDAGAGCRRG